MVLIGPVNSMGNNDMYRLLDVKPTDIGEM
jgi:hypothetical protein